MARKTPTSPPGKTGAESARPATGSARPASGSARPASGSARPASGSARPASGSARKGRPAPTARQARIEELKKAQKSRERRTITIIVAACSVLVLVLGAVIAYAIVDARRNAPENVVVSVGAPTSAAACDAVTTDPASGNADHVGPGTNRTDITRIAYSTVPPTSGSHFVQPVLDGRQFYAPEDTPAVETLVHNLEHGYTILWYLPSDLDTDRSQLMQLAGLGNKLAPSQGKFIVAPWDTSRGQFPEGKKYALSHWSGTTDDAGKVTAQNGHRQLCGSLSGEVVQSFVTQFPKTDAPEPLGA